MRIEPDVARRNPVIILIVVLVVVLIAVVGTSKMGTYVEVGRESLADKIGKAIGEFRVKRTEARNGIAKLENSVKRLRQGQIMSEVESEQIAKRLETISEKKAAVESSLGKLRELIVKNEPAILGGKEYSVADLQSLAEKMINTYKSSETQATGIEKARAILIKNANSLKVKVTQAKERIIAMKSQLDEVDAKLLALSTMQEAAETAGGGPEALAANFEDVQDQLNSLYAEVETGLRMEEMSWQEASALGSVDVDQVIKDTQDVESTLSKIDNILGN